MIIAHVKPTDQQKAEIDALLAAKRPATLEALAAKLEVTPLEAAQLLDPDMCAFVTGEASEIFDDVWASLAAWERDTLFIVSAPTSLKSTPNSRPANARSATTTS